MIKQPRATLHIPALAIPVLALLFASCASTDTGRHEVAEAGAPLLASTQLVLESISGETHDLNAILADGKPVAFVFWQTWCGSCLAEAPHVGEAARALAGQVQFVGVVPGPNERVDDAKIVEIATESRMEFPQVRDRDMALSRAFDVTGTPTIVVLRPDGTTGFTGHGLPATYAELR